METTISLRGISIVFPFKPYQVQRVLMERIVEALDEKTNALLESPTGTGKTLSLLCATRAWQETRPSPKPIIIYASRTHSQLEQVAKELKRTCYAGKALVISSRETSCTHPEASLAKGRDQIVKCRHLVDNKQCSQKERTSIEVRKPGPVPDIEDIIRPQVGLHYCPYYYSRDVLAGTINGIGKSIDMVFMPYNYLIDPTVRRGIHLQWNDAIVIIDEAHNIEDVCEDACSFSLCKSDLFSAISDIDALSNKCLAHGGILPKHDVVIDDLAKIKALLKGLNECFNVNYQATLKDANPIRRKGSDLFDLLQSQGLTLENYRLLIGKLEACVEALHPHGRALEVLVKCIVRAFELGGEELDYPTAKRVAGESYRIFFERSEDNVGWKLNFWCFSAGVAMGELSKLGVRSIIVASGTLSPLDSVASSLRLPFPIRLESPHVVSGDRIWLGVVPKGVTGKTLNCSYENRDNVDYQQELGRTLAAVVRLIPDGILVFFPSYAVLKTCLNTWKQSDVWERLVKAKQTVLVEERGGVDIEKVYDQALGNGGGAMLFAVCRGKASEGMDFRDKRARGVIVVGLPFPSKNDPRVVHKRLFMDETRAAAAAASAGMQLLSGQAWYSQQAYRAVNQAVGRAIRHEHDYGAIILLDERFAGFRNQLSLWLRPYFRTYVNGVGEAIMTLAPFFRSLKNSEPVVEAIAKPVQLAPLPKQAPPLAKVSSSSSSLVNTITKDVSIIRASPATSSSSVQFNNANKGETTVVRLTSSSSSSSSAAAAAAAVLAPQSRSLSVTSTRSLSIDNTSSNPRFSASAQVISSSSSSSSSLSLDQIKRTRVDIRSERVVDFLKSVKSALITTEAYEKFKQLLREFKKAHEQGKLAPEANTQMVQLFSTNIRDVEERKSLLQRLAQHLGSAHGNALRKEARLM